MKNNFVKRLIPFLFSILIVTACVISKNQDGDVPVTSVIGAYISIILVSIILYKFPYRIYVLSIFFTISASSFGSILRFYDKFPMYDRYVHFISGIILADIGYCIMSYILNRSISKSLWGVSLLFAAFFSFACAALWEIYEFTSDQILNINMQGSNLDTMGDIVSGVLGGIIYTVVCLYRKKRLLSSFFSK